MLLILVAVGGSGAIFCIIPDIFQELLVPRTFQTTDTDSWS
jgi:hypothetical protein